MSSAILYVAIVAIWAGVLIPRWLRRDSSSSESVAEDLTTAEPDSAASQEPAPRPRRQDHAPGRPEKRTEARPEVPQARREAPPGEPRRPRDQEHKQVLSARRRLLGMLLMLVIGSGALAFTKLAAWWVVVPSAVMLLGYTALLREAAKADAERRELARAHAAGTAAAAPPAAPLVPPPAPDAEVIAISASLDPAGQEFYDQYADAKLRAVGD